MPKIISGIVTANANDKTITVKTEVVKQHPIYRKQFRISKKYLVHDETNQAEIGDEVRIIECRPRSARKRFELESIVKRASIKQSDKVENLQLDELSSEAIVLEKDVETLDVKPKTKKVKKEAVK